LNSDTAPTNVVKDYRELLVWQKAMDLARSIYTITWNFPAHESYGLTSQMRRCAVSVPSNIAEGQARHKTTEFMRFIHIALGSLAELDTQVILSCDFGYINPDQRQVIEQQISELRRMISGLLRSLKP